MVRVRGLADAVREIKEKDPKSPIKVYTLRQWVKQGYIKPIPCGRVQVLINMEELEKFMEGGK